MFKKGDVIRYQKYWINSAKDNENKNPMIFVKYVKAHEIHPTAFVKQKNVYGKWRWFNVSASFFEVDIEETRKSKIEKIL